MDDELLLLVGEVPPLDPGPQVVGPPEPTALAAPHQPCKQPFRQTPRTRQNQEEEEAILAQAVQVIVTCSGRDGAPVAGAVLLDVGDEDEVLLRRPRALLDAVLVAARRPHHGRWRDPRTGKLDFSDRWMDG